VPSLAPDPVAKCSRPAPTPLVQAPPVVRELDTRRAAARGAGRRRDWHPALPPHAGPGDDATGTQGGIRMRIRLRLRRLQRQQPRRRLDTARGRVRLPNVLHLLPREAGDALHVAPGVCGWHPVSARVPAMRTRKRRRPAEVRQFCDAPAERRSRGRERGHGGRGVGGRWRSGLDTPGMPVAALIQPCTLHLRRCDMQGAGATTLCNTRLPNVQNAVAAKRRSMTLALRPRTFVSLPAGCCCRDRRPLVQVSRWLSAQTERHQVRVEIPLRCFLGWRVGSW
jgi:hypothetical protein